MWLLKRTNDGITTKKMHVIHHPNIKCKYTTYTIVKPTPILFAMEESI